MEKRRKTDSCIMRSLYEQATPYLQVIGYVVLLAGIIFSAGSAWNRAQATESKVSELMLWKENTIGQLSGMKQEIDDLHNWYKEDRKK